MKLLLVYPEKEALGLSQIMMAEPVALEYLAAGVSSKHEVKILDLRIPGQNLIETILKWEPDSVGFTGFTLHVPEIISLSRAVKEIATDIKVMVGGHHATFLPESFMVPSIDIIARWECESIIDQLLEYKLSNVPGVIYKHNNAWSVNQGEPLSIFTRLTPAHHLVRDYTGYYHIFNAVCLGTQISRGCPYNCSFCDSQKFFHRKSQIRDVSTIITELENAPQKFVFPVDENIGINKKVLTELASQVSERGIDKRYLFTTGAREILSNKELLDRWFDIGLRALFVGLERIDDKDIAGLGKKTTVAMNDAAISYVHSRDGIVIGSFIILPTDTEDYFKRLEEYVRSRQIEVPMFCILTPFPGTDLWDEYKELSDDFSEYDLLHAVMPTYLPKEEFYRLFHDLYHTVNLRRLIWKLLRVFGVGNWLLKLPKIKAGLKRLE